MRRNGFTLIELLVALVIFAMLAGAGVLLLGNSVAAQGQVRERLDELASIQRVRGALSADLGQASPRISRHGAGTLAPVSRAQSDDDDDTATTSLRAGVVKLRKLPRPLPP